MAPVAAWRHEQVFEAQPPSVAGARDFVGLHLLAHRQPQLVAVVRLVVSELATNAVIHARTPFRVSLSRLQGSVLLAVRDQAASTPVRSAPDLLGPGGRGLTIVEALSHVWGTSTNSDGFKSVWASFPGAI